MIYYPNIIPGTKPSHVDSLLDDRVAVWIVTFPTVLRLLPIKSGQCPKAATQLRQCLTG
jgi:hypothetical protein